MILGEVSQRYAELERGAVRAMFRAPRAARGANVKIQDLIPNHLLDSNC